MVISKQNAYFSSFSSRKFVRKCFLIMVVLIITICNIYLKHSIKRASNADFNQEYSELINETLPFNNQDAFIDSKQNQNPNGFNGKFERNLLNIFLSRKLQEKTPNDLNNQKNETNSTQSKTYKIGAEKPLIPLINSKNVSCINPAYMEFPSDIFSQRARARGAILLHIAIVCYMFYCLAVVCDHYFLPSLEECCLRLNLSQDVAGATFMAAGSSAPELFTAILGVFIAKGDVGTGTIVGSAVFNILFVIGLCSLYTVSTELNWWPVVRDSSYYTFTVLILIMCIYDGEVTCFESFILLLFYAVYIIIMKYNIQIRDIVYQQWQTRFPVKPVDELNNIQANALQAVHYKSFPGNELDEFGVPRTQYGGGQSQFGATTKNPFIIKIPEVTIFEAANQIIIKYKRLFRAKTRFRAAAFLIIIRARKAKKSQTELLARSASLESQKMSKLGPDDDFWRIVPDPNVDGLYATVKWALIAPLYASLFYTIPDCRTKKHLFLLTFFISIVWTAIFSYIMVWMVTMIGFTMGIPDSIMGITFLAAGTSVPDAYGSIHVAKMGRADMAVSNSIGSNVFDILVGLALPWFVETAIVEPGTVSNINSGGLVYAVMLLFLSLIATVYLFHRHNWTLNPNLGYSLLITYGIFLIFSSAIEFNLFGKVNPPICGE